jgi:hypothetical protein
MSDRWTGTICEQCNSLLVRRDDPLDSSVLCAKIIHIYVRAESICDSVVGASLICVLGEHYLRLKSKIVHHPLRVRLYRSYHGNVFSDTYPLLPLGGFAVSSCKLAITTGRIPLTDKQSEVTC